MRECISYNHLEAFENGSVLNKKNKKNKKKDQKESSEESLLKNWPLMSSLTIFCVFSFHDMAYAEVSTPIP